MRDPASRRGQRLAAAVWAAACLSPGVSLAQPRQWHALPVAGGTDAVAAAAGLGPGLPAWRVLFEAARRRHGLWGEDSARAVGEGAGAPPPAPGAVVALPLAPDTWRGLLARDDLPDERLALAIVADRPSSLLYRGLAAFDEPTLAALAAEPLGLARIRRRHADALAAFGARFRVRDGAVDLPGGEEAATVWRGLVDVSPREPVRFLEILLAAKGGRRAFLYDSVARLDPPHQRFALGMRLAGDPERAAAAKALAAVFDRENAWWRSQGGAFSRPAVDAARLLREARVGSDGALAPPSSRAFWDAVFEGRSAGPRPAWVEEVRAAPRADAAWLAERIGSGDAAARRLRFEQLAFGQRVFGAAAADALPEALLALQGLRDTRALLLALERMGPRDPSLYAAGVLAARRAGAVRDEALRVQWTLQGALAVIDRARFARTLDAAVAERLTRSLFDAPTPADGYGRSIAAWAEGALLPELARAVYGTQPPGDPDATVLRAMAGYRAERGLEEAPFEWEGLWYKADPGQAELSRLERVRAKQGGAGLAEALRACRLPAENSGDRCSAALGPALVSLVYAAHVGEPDGPALAGEDVSLRHDFGAEPWALPEEVSGPGAPWHVRGSLLGLERALAGLSLHRLAGDALPEGPPVLGSAQRRSLAVPAVLANARELTDADRDAAAGAIAAGRRRASSLRAGGPGVEDVCREAGLDPWRARAFEWLLEHEPAARDSFFSLEELLHLGSPDGRRWDGWGVADDLTRGLGLGLPGPRPLDEASGRMPEPALAETFVDLGLRVAVHLSERRLPASLAPAMVETLLPDLFAEARPVAPDDRLGLDAWVRAQPPERLDDAVASLAGRGPLQAAPRPGETR